jgi:23S rRNA-/tRNA-specific pseudouridylate synthase
LSALRRRRPIGATIHWPPSSFGPFIPFIPFGPFGPFNHCLALPSLLAHALDLDHRCSRRHRLPPLRPGAAEILYCDAALLVVNKPAGLLAVPGRGEDKQDCLSGACRPNSRCLIVHRLDMHTSGVLVLARGKEMQRR